MDQEHKDYSSARPKLRKLPRGNSKSNSVCGLSVTRESQEDVRRHSHTHKFDGIELAARGSLQSSCHYGSAPSLSSKKLLHESLSEGSLPRTQVVLNMSLNEVATIPFGLMYELQEQLNPLGHETLNQLALMIGMKQEHFDKLYKSARNPAISLLTEAEKFLKTLEDLEVALSILELPEAVALIQKHQPEGSRKAATTKPKISIPILSSDSDYTNSDDGDIRTPVFSLGDTPIESVDDSNSGSTEVTDWIILQRDGEKHEGNMLHTPDDGVASDLTGASQKSFPGHKELQSSSSHSKTSSKEGDSPVYLPFTEVRHLGKSDGSQVDSGYGSTEHSAVSSESFSSNITSYARDCIDAEKFVTPFSESLTPNLGALSASDCIDETGGVLYIPNTSISLLIPEGALKRPQEIKLTVTTDPTFKGCPQSANHPRLTPLVSCEPDGLEFLIAAELTLPHCGVITDPKQSVEVYVRRGGEGEETKWKKDEYASRNAVFNINTCSIPITHFCDFDVFVRNDDGIIMGKKMRAFPMANCLKQSSDDILLSLWMCNDYDQAYNVLTTGSQHVRKIVLDDYNCYFLEASQQSVNVDYHNLSDMWTLQSNQEEIGFHQLWYGSKAKATFRLKCNNSTGGGKVDGTLTVKQKEHCESTKFEVQYQVTDLLEQQEAPQQQDLMSLQTQVPYVSQCSVASVQGQSSRTEQGSMGATSPLSMARRNGDEIYIPPTTPTGNHLHLHFPSPSNGHPDLILPQSPPPTFQVHYELILKLSQLLNGDNVLGDDWRILASDLGYSTLDISTFERSKNPTKEVLEDACKKGKLESYNHLRSLLKNRERMDAIDTLNRFLEKQNTDTILPAIEAPGSTMKPKLFRQCSEAFSVSSLEPALAMSRGNSATIVQQLPVQCADVSSSEQQQPSRHCQSGISGQFQDQMPPETLYERGTFNLPANCRTSTPRRLCSTIQEDANIDSSVKHVKGHGNDSGIDSPDTSRPQSRRRAKYITLAPHFGESMTNGVAESEANESGHASLASDTSLIVTQSSHCGIASQSSSDDSGLPDSPEELVSFPQLDNLNNGFS